MPRKADGNQSEIVELLERSRLLLNALLGTIPPKRQETTWKNIVRKTRELIADIQNILPEEK